MKGLWLVAVASAVPLSATPMRTSTHRMDRTLLRVNQNIRPGPRRVNGEAGR
jgi:hypothetical protein